MNKLFNVILGLGFLLILGAGIYQMVKPILPPISTRDKQIAYLREHEQEIIDFVKSANPKVESVQIDWSQTQWGKIGNGTPQGGGDAIDVYGGFNNIEDSDWGIVIGIKYEKDGQIRIKSMWFGSPLSIGGELLE
ncbi:hypothetical protein GGG87_06630 [Streptococcus sp. zg-86]|uniref:Uncharacterized protein n=1 Tax=Streptococcus zhangguiae TaxID=2664091 RepID=A0A6I4RAV8_9STRE|nr:MULTISPECIES: hypothetical protein [unclassified Streptococcus]MTB64668.1 hypothetical protein [Streptococcus sp. zg-86]MTB90978.1 hypothetical protein [Streptococcus sp. zg-36]MWV56599.1 hypothetical protein [Streptococcus sp. zg-70]QTH48559.1 hypothetical protein J5M87_04365 [Streptococcus sp. zg-86]